MQIQACNFAEGKLFYFYFSNILNVFFVILLMKFFTQLYVRPPPDDRFLVDQVFEYFSQEIIFLSASPLASNFIPQIDANQTYFWLLPKHAIEDLKWWLGAILNAEK